MERSGPAFFEDDQEDETTLAPYEAAPAPEEALSFTEKLKKILGFEDDDEDDEEEPGTKKKKGVFKRLFSNIPGVVGMDHAEEAPEPPVERNFSLAFLGAPETDESLIQPHEAEPATVVEPEADEPMPPAEEHEPTLSPPPIEAAPAPVAAEEEPEVPPLPPTPTYRPPVAPPMPLDAYPLRPAAPEHDTPGPTPVPETEDFVTKREAKRYAKEASHEATKKAKKEAKKREHKIEEKATERIEDLREQADLERYRQQVREAALRHQIRDQEPVAVRQEAPAPIPVPVPERAPKPQPVSIEQPRPVHASETYSPDVHDQIPPRVAFEKLTGVEPPRARSLEQERRFEVQDVASKTPASYARADLTSPWQQPVSSAPQSHRATMVNLGSSNTPTPTPTPRPPATNQPYKTAVISGVVTAAVLLAVFLAIAVLF